MQLSLDLDDRPRTLAEIHLRLQRHFGPQGPFELRDSVSQLALGLIGGRTHSGVSKSALDGLRVRFDSWEDVRDAPVTEIRKSIGAVTFAEDTAPRLKAALEPITEHTAG